MIWALSSTCLYVPHIHLITYTPPWRLFTYIGHSLGGLFHFFSDIQEVFLHWVIVWEMPVKCGPNTHGNTSDSIMDHWSVLLPAVRYKEKYILQLLCLTTQSTFNTSSQKKFFKKHVKSNLFFTQNFSKSPHFTNNKSYIHTTATVPCALLPAPHLHPYFSSIIYCFPSLATLSWRA